ncbi:30S ribosomal protein S2 [Blattabacterium cuenoti]|nr:30S ribosomal protein S2 [Blattabacterium cuenoti]
MKINTQDLLKAGVHFGHIARKWHPNMRPFIFMKKGGIHIIDLSKTVVKLNKACEELENIVFSGKKILLVGTKDQAKEKVSYYAKIANMPCVTERWLGGLLTNFTTIRKSVKKMNNIEKMKKNGTFNTLSKKEKLLIDRLYTKLYKNLGSISNMNHIPGGIFLVDPNKEKIALSEAKKLKIPVFAMVDTNTNPNEIEYPIPSNDDSSKSINIILKYVSETIQKASSSRNKNDTINVENKIIIDNNKDKINNE